MRHARRQSRQRHRRIPYWIVRIMLPIQLGSFAAYGKIQLAQVVFAALVLLTLVHPGLVISDAFMARRRASRSTTEDGLVRPNGDSDGPLHAGTLVLNPTGRWIVSVGTLGATFIALMGLAYTYAPGAWFILPAGAATCTFCAVWALTSNKARESHGEARSLRETIWLRVVLDWLDQIGQPKLDEDVPTSNECRPSGRVFGGTIDRGGFSGAPEDIDHPLRVKLLNRNAIAVLFIGLAAAGAFLGVGLNRPLSSVEIDEVTSKAIALSHLVHHKPEVQKPPIRAPSPIVDPSPTTSAPVATSTPVTTSTSVPSAADLCGQHPLTILQGLPLLTSREAMAVDNVLGPAGVDATGCPGITPVSVGNFIVVPLKKLAGTPFFVTIADDGRATLIDPAAAAIVGNPTDGFSAASILSDDTVISIEGMYANAPPADPNNRRAFLYIVRRLDGTCQLLVRTEPQPVFVSLPVSVSRLVVDFAAGRGYVHVGTVVGGAPGEYDVAVLDSAGKVVAEEEIHYDARSGRATDDTGAQAGSSVMCPNLLRFMKRYPDGAEYMSY